MRTFEALPPPRLTARDLTPVVRSASGRHDAVPLSWTVGVIQPGIRARATGGVFRCQGELETGGDRRPWSAVLKVLRLRHWQPTPEDLLDQLDDGGNEPADVAYWLREALLYEEGVLSYPQARLRPPRLLASARPAQDQCWLWLEDVPGVAGTDWEASRWVLAAGHLGQFQGHFAEHRPAPRAWFGPSFLATPGPARRAGLLRLFDEPATWADPLISATFDRATVAIAREVGRRHEELAARAMAGTPTICHRDPGPANLFAPGQDQTVAIDWALAGIGPLAEDLAIMFCLAAPAAAGQAGLAGFQAALLRGYRLGLLAAGCAADPEEIRAVFCIVAALQCGILAGLLARSALQPGWRRRKEKETGLPASEVVNDRFALVSHTLHEVVSFL